ncbi:hypothetical protein PN462_04985 [Spirulina sp. CS-785/01]|uniref:hypothetical protein n=1 Tax=Spirulina sp. CS-785/01 TaxID=3021716 RepID=UPI00232D69B8|nr:hypothetical protein [Spirulina sp. CS-785/01]MDB9312451.1 hypothetical protein [Spirulina sp. CS-785/01]
MFGRGLETTVLLMCGRIEGRVGDWEMTDAVLKRKFTVTVTEYQKMAEVGILS